MTERDPETQSSCAEWARDTFGPARPPERLAKRLETEVRELHAAIRNESSEAVALEAADCLILLYRIAEEAGVSLHDALDRKMAINRQRQWVPAGDGTGSHLA
ncbi:dATP/dGTP pyrophosphohydrolase domain-containing protein [Yunchengibacter salinarum]|uniref:dATP/dGTP pyrophosphohydrolase domain-containing protein n=1 Tax=Yunchengibacter salinarum TaxID=3133399 RepID=UPI0035B624C3